MKKILKTILSILIIGGLVLMIGLAGQLDHDEYIEAELKPKSRLY